MNGVSKITVSEDILLVTFRKVPNDLKLLSQIFTELTNLKVNLDMISQTAPQSNLIDVSFTLFPNQLVDMLGLMNRFCDAHGIVKPMISGGNCKIQLYGEEMREMYGVAASAIAAVASTQSDLTLISTGEVEISLLVPQAGCAEATAALEAAFGVKAE